MTLKKACVKDQWNSLEELNMKGVDDQRLKNGQGHLNNTTGGQVTERDNIRTSNTGHLNGTTGSQVTERDNIKTSNTVHLNSGTGGQVAEKDNIKTGSTGHLNCSTGGQVTKRDDIKTGSTRHLNSSTEGQVTESDNIKTGSTGHLNSTTGGQVTKRDNIKTESTGYLNSTTGGQVTKRDNIKTESAGYLNSTTGGQVAERDNLKFKTENGGVNLEHCNGNNGNFSNENQTRVKNKLGLDAEGVPDSLADDADDLDNISNEMCENIRTKQTVNSNNDKGCEVNEKINRLDDNSEDILCNEMNITGSDSCACDSTTKERDTACAHKDPTITSGNVSKITNHTEKSNDITEPNKIKVQDFDDSRHKDNVVQENKSFKLSYDAKKHDCRPGSVGLVNHANLCYINSVVQCLSSVIELRTYLLSKKYSSHINRDNKNGYHGELISAFDSLIQELWSGKERSVSASKLKQ
ncbi:PREDICTED: uncharacterized protein LOC105333816 isoform X12 [Paramuricea clavata]|nr:PREDICTED: uncharacterized protein LOC105333816 isoform X12 [Paramuricea clavata]